MSCSLVTTVSEFAFDKYELQRIHARVLSHNSRSAGLLKQTGYKLEGRLRNHLFRGGKPVDVLLFGILKDELLPGSDETHPPSSEPRIDLSPTPLEVGLLDDRLEEFNAQQTGRADFKPLSLVIRGKDGSLIAGLKGMTGWDWLYVQTLWVDEDHRRSGLRSQLLEAAETVARERQCIGACLSSYSFQAPEFYHSHGYSTFGEIEDYPLGNTMFFLSKRFQQERSDRLHRPEAL